MAANGLVHSPLSQERSIRVLELLPSRDVNSPISCLVKERNLDDGVKYEALSYVWGARVPGHFVFVEDKILPVTPNCLEALRHLRLESERRVLWIDAICIDQTGSGDSTRERNHQVQLMGTIYSKARSVIVWLGVSEPTTRRTFSRIKRIYWIPEGMWRARQRLFETMIDVTDRVYALYSVLLMYGLSLPKPDYHKPFELIYEEVIWAYIDSQQELSILQIAARPTYVQGLPSWVPAYHLENGGFGVASSVGQPTGSDPHRAYGHFILETCQTFTKTENPYARHAGAQHSPRTLRVAGRYIGKAVFSRGEDRLGSEHRLMVCWEWCRRVHESSGGHTHSPGYNDALLGLYKAMTLKLAELPQVTPRSRHEYGFHVFNRWFHTMISTTTPEELQ
ncbi:hypothetical protein VPNG_09042 [Cytospora leucostoma]|uniref:Heterokaryon incompatibility domain-containing protein n=1 Tax=Cytospora leucostoma TaxID=1230097 RepID=A0A423VZ02_9PEZI|nr:hypothetical protein VPNG_09042 [Cytospora leucostoma]